MTRVLRSEIETFVSSLPGLLKTNPGKFVLISGTQVKGAFEDFETALRKGYDECGPGSFLIRQILPEQKVEYVSCGVRLACPA